MSNINKHIKKLSTLQESDRSIYIDQLEIKNYGSNELTETDMWMLKRAATQENYLNHKLYEVESLSLDMEAPEESDELSLDDASSTEPELSLDDASSTEPELSLDDASSTEPELSLDDASSTEPEIEISSDIDVDISDEHITPPENETDISDDEPSDDGKIETSKEGIGILALLGEIQEKLANGKPSEVELAALKAIKKLVG